MDTLVVNLIGAPGCGKSTLMAIIFGKLKCMGINVEMVTEFAKELVYENRKDTMKDELYIFAKQAHRLFIVKNKVDVIITDRPLLLTVVYNNRYSDGSKELNNLVLKTFNEYNNLNFNLKRINKYIPIGRVETEKESDEIAAELTKILDNNHIKYINTNSKEENIEYIIDVILENLKNRKE